MQISIIIPTHNRAESLRRTLDSVSVLKSEADFEIVVVDNNSTDHTKGVVGQFSSIARYVFESNTSFTRARRTGADHATGNVLLYLDDDVLVGKGSLTALLEVLSGYPDCGVIAGKILPSYECDPPDWAIACQQAFNGWSLYCPAQIPALGSGFQEVDSAAGPMMAFRRTAYDIVNGFPPDTVGVETNRGKKTFQKLYIGPGDYGICTRIRRAGLKVYYSPRVYCHHVIPTIRFTVPFWRSRMIGEGQHLAFTNREFHKMGAYQLKLERLGMESLFRSWKQKLQTRLVNSAKYLAGSGFSGMLFEELWLHYAKGYLDMDAFLDERKDVSATLWAIGLEGVSGNNFDQITSCLPSAFWNLVAPEKMYSDRLIITLDALHECFPLCHETSLRTGKELFTRAARNLLPPLLTTQIRRLYQKHSHY